MVRRIKAPWSISIQRKKNYLFNITTATNVAPGSGFPNSSTLYSFCKLGGTRCKSISSSIGGRLCPDCNKQQESRLRAQRSTRTGTSRAPTRTHVALNCWSCATNRRLCETDLLAKKRADDNPGISDTFSPSSDRNRTVMIVCHW